MLCQEAMMTAVRWAFLISIVAVGVRLIAINQPLVGNWSWRQSDVAAIARNYLHNGFHFARPQIDWAGDQPGYVGTEFPILPFAAAICYKFLGVHEWIGRIQAVIFFAISLPFFFLIARRLLPGAGATWALLFYSFAPLGIMTSRCFIPDTPSLILSLIGLYFFQRWTSSNDRASFFLAAIAISLSILIKATSVIIGVPLACLTVAAVYDRRYQKQFSAHRAPLQLIIFAAIALVPAAIWYWYAYEISLRFYPYHFFGAGGVKIMSLAWYWKIAKEIPWLTLTPIGFGLAVVGLFTASRSKQLGNPLAPFYWWLAAMIFFIIVVGYGNRHPWYRLPLVPIAAVFAGSACEFLAARTPNRPIRVIGSIALVTSLGFFAFSSLRVLYQPTTTSLYDAGLLLKKITPEGSLVAAADNGDPTLFYYGERKGWHFLEKNGIFNGDPAGSEPAIANLRELREKGANYLVFGSDTMWILDLYPEFREYLHANSALVAATSQFEIYRLDPMSK